MRPTPSYSGQIRSVLNVLLHAIEKRSAYYGLTLTNYGKCVNPTANKKQSSVRFSPSGPAQGRLVPRKSSATYLGTLLTDTFDNRAEVSNRVGDCIATCNRMKLFWNKANNSIEWKIQVFNAIVRSKLLYGLECVQLTNAELSTLNAFQNKSLRRILHIPPTFINREQTNVSMYDKIRNEYGCSFEHFAMVVLLSTLQTHGARQSSDFLDTYCEPAQQIL